MARRPGRHWRRACVTGRVTLGVPTERQYREHADPRRINNLRGEIGRSVITLRAEHVKSREFWPDVRDLGLDPPANI